MSGITTLCFAGSYAVALGLEVARLGWRGRLRAVLAIGFAGAGLFAETVYLGHRAATAASSPLSSAYEWYLLAAWALVAVYLYLSLFHSMAASGIFILPLALALVGAARFASQEPFQQTPAKQVWGTIHGTFWLLGTVAVIFGFVAGVMYLLQSSRLKRLSQSRRKVGAGSVAARHPHPGPLPSREREEEEAAGRAYYVGLRLPSLEWLERANGKAIVVSVLMVGAGFVSGIVLNLIEQGQHYELPWSDPIVWRSAGLLGWLLAAALFSAVYRPARRGRKVAYLTVASFVFLAIFLAAQLVGHTEHDGSGGAATDQRAACRKAADKPIASAETPRTRNSWETSLMKLQMVGCSHHNSSLALRERLAFNPSQAAAALDLWRRRFPAAEAVLLSTCNRVELYTAWETDAVEPNHQQVAEFLAEFHGLDLHAIFDDLFEQSGEAAVRHLFTVAASVDSMVLGEPQILAQVKQAYQLAQQHESAGPLTHEMFQAALHVAKRVASETSIARKRVSIASVAVGDFARDIFDRFDDKQVLVIGAGEMGEEALRYLRDEGARQLTIVNRSTERAAAMAEQFAGRAARWEQLDELLVAADLVVSTTGAAEPIVTLERFQRIEPRRYQRPLLILDLAVPRDFEPAIGDRLGVYLYSIDDLEAVCQRNRRERDGELPAAIAIIEQETQRFMEDLHHRATGPVVQRLRQNWQELRDQELERLFNKLPNLPEAEREEIRRSFERYVNKMLHPPLERIRDESRQGHPHGLLEALKRLFHLKD